MNKKYKIQLPKGKAVVTVKTNIDNDNGVMTMDVDFCDTFIMPPIPPKYEPKDGDFVYVKARYEHIAIFKKEIGEDMYVYANWNMSFSVSKIIIDDSKPLCCIHDLRGIRPATEREKKILIDQLEKVNKKWNPETKRIEDVRWRTGICCPYYYINPFGDVEYDKRLEIFDPETMYSDKDLEVIGYTDDNFYNSGNYFKTRKAAEKVAEQIREIFKKSKAE